MKHAIAGVLNIAYLESGPPNGIPVILSHGFPYDVHAFDVVSNRLAAAGLRCIVPYLRGYGSTEFLHPGTPRSGQQAALGADLLALMDALDIPSALLGGFDWGGRAACVAAALRPQRVRGLVSCGTGYNIQNIAQAGEPAEPEKEYRAWYQYYFNTERGRAGLKQNRHAFCRLLWHLWSPTWQFDETSYAQSAESFDNPGFVDVVIHSYRHRLGAAPGDQAYDDFERTLAVQPRITVPSIILKGDSDGVEGSVSAQDTDAEHFSGYYERRIVPGIGHNLPQEAPEAFAEAVLALTKKVGGAVPAPPNPPSI